MQGRGLLRLLSQSLLLELGNFSRKLGSIVSFSDKPVFLHQHFDAVLLIDHLLLVVHHFQTFSSLVHLLELIGHCNGFASDRHRHLGFFDNDLTCDRMYWGTRSS